MICLNNVFITCILHLFWRCVKEKIWQVFTLNYTDFHLGSREGIAGELECCNTGILECWERSLKHDPDHHSIILFIKTDRFFHLSQSAQRSHQWKIGRLECWEMLLKGNPYHSSTIPFFHHSIVPFRKLCRPKRSGREIIVSYFFSGGRTTDSSVCGSSRGFFSARFQCPLADHN